MFLIGLFPRAIFKYKEQMTLGRHHSIETRDTNYPKRIITLYTIHILLEISIILPSHFHLYHTLPITHDAFRTIPLQYFHRRGCGVCHSLSFLQA